MSEARQSRKNYFETWPGLADWHERQRRYVRATGYVRSLIGRKRRLPQAQYASNEYERAEAERQAINSPVQSLASDWNIAAALELKHVIDPRHMRMAGTIHDATLVWVRPYKLSPVIKKGLRIFSDPYLIKKLGLKMRVPMEAEAQIGPWGKGVSYDEYASRTG